MKKTILVAATTLAGMILFNSCNKDYECVCRLNGTETNRYSVREKTKNAAEDVCNEKQSSLGVTYSCKIE
jgi:hypothetical protein